jgi:hypothetical protein
VTNYFPADSEWLSHSANIAYSRAAWLALGGYSPQFTLDAALNFNVMLALHYGMENLGEALASCEWPSRSISRKRACSLMEFWLILRQARNYCLAAKLPWNQRCLFLASLHHPFKRR